MPEVSTTIIFTSVIVLVVVELSRMIRDDDIHTKATNQRGIPYLPKLGMFSTVHTMNYVFLGTGWYISGTTPFGNNIMTVMATNFVYISLLFLLPYLEYEEYDFHLSGVRGSNSFNLHSISVILTILGPATILGTAQALMNYNEPFSTHGPYLTIAFLIFGPLLFLTKLKQEILNPQQRYTQYLKESLEDITSGLVEYIR